MLDSQPLGVAKQAVEIDTQCMSGKLGVQAGTHAGYPLGEAVRVIDFDLKLLG